MEKEEAKTEIIEPPVSVSPYHQNIKEKLQVECRYDVEAWYEILKEFTFPTSFLPLSIPEAKAIRSLYKHRFLHGEKLNEKDSQCLENLKDKIDNTLKLQFQNKPIFLRLSTRSPKDSALDFDDAQKNSKYTKGISDVLKGQGITRAKLLDRIKKIPKKTLDIDDYLSLLTPEESNAVLIYLMNATKEVLKITNASQALDLLTSSERVSVDIYQMLVYKNVDEKESEEELCQIVFREWFDIDDLEEFRCFFYGKKLTAISQYNFYVYDKNLTENKESIKEKIYNEFMKISYFLNVENGVIDFAVQKDKVWVIELNPFNDYKGAGTGGALFSWTQDIKVLMEGPLEIRVVEKTLENCSHTIEVFGAEKLLVDILRNLLDQPDKLKNSDEKNSCIIF